METFQQYLIKDVNELKSTHNCNYQYDRNQSQQGHISHPCSWIKCEAGYSRRRRLSSPNHVVCRLSSGKMIMCRILLILLLSIAIVTFIILKHVGSSSYVYILRKHYNSTDYKKGMKATRHNTGMAPTRSNTKTKPTRSNTKIKSTIDNTVMKPTRKRPVNNTQQAYRLPKSSRGYPFNPDQFDNSTVNPNKKYIIIYWSKIRGNIARIQRKIEYEQNQHIWPYTYAGDTCPVPCELTNNRSRAHEASAFVVHSRLTDVWDVPPLRYLAPWILQNNENPVYTPALSDKKIMNKFNLLISYRLDSDFPSPIYPKPSLDPPLPFKDRLGTVLAVFSKCEAVRTEYMKQLMKYIDVHSYGACLKNRQGLIGLYGQINGRYVFKDYKFVMSRYYKFSLVFMNQDCDYFVDDRLYHALETGSIPIYMGTDKIDPFLPGNLKNAIINVRDFKSPRYLAEYLKYLSQNETAFNKYMEWKLTGIGDYENTTIGRWWNQKYPLFCQVCMRLAQGQLHMGLDVDRCRARTYQDLGLDTPYPITFERNATVNSIPDKEPSYVQSLALLGIVATLIILLANAIKCWTHLGRERTI